MTICIATLADKGKKAIIVSDRMITAGDTEYEGEETKIEKVCKNCAAITAGSALAPTEILKKVADDFCDQPMPLVEKVAESVKKHFVQLRLRRAEEEYFKPLGLTIKEFLKSQKELEETVVIRLTRSLEQAKLKLRILLTGVDKTGGHIYYISDPGTSEIFDSIGYCAIGSGDRHADGVLIDNDYNTSMPLKRALYLVYEAKKRAEKAPGVGEKVDIVIVAEDNWTEIKDKELTQLETIYKRKRELEAGLQESIKKEIEGITI